MHLRIRIISRYTRSHDEFAIIRELRGTHSHRETPLIILVYDITAREYHLASCDGDKKFYRAFSSVLNAPRAACCLPKVGLTLALTRLILVGAVYVPFACKFH